MEYIGLVQTEERKAKSNATEQYCGKSVCIEYDTTVSRIVTSIDISKCTDDSPIYRIMDTIWDTGATTSVISERMARKIGLQPVDVGIGITPAGRLEIPYYMLDIHLSKDLTIPNVKVCGFPLEDNGADFLIGMDIISKGNLEISNINGKTRLRFQLTK